MIDLYEQCLTLAKIAAKPHGYAVALHGTGFRDLDLLLVPWTEEACEPAKVVLSIIGKFQWEFGTKVTIEPGDMAALQAKANGEIKESSWPSSMVKPHGRAAITIHVGGNYFVDLSVMPRQLKDEKTG